MESNISNINTIKNNQKAKQDFSYLFTAEKAGMIGLDREQINKTITEATKHTRIAKRNKEDLEKMKEEAEKINEKLNNFHKNGILLKQIIEAANLRISQLKNERRLDKVWFHIDMDMFFAAVEIRDDPTLANIPMAVGSLQMLSTSNYIARKYGVRSAMPGFLGKVLCPNLKIVPLNYSKYSEESSKIMNILSEYDPNLERMGIDEAYLDLTDYLNEKDIKGEEYIKKIALEIKEKIFNTTKLTCSCGIACSKLLAKICSDYQKPNGLFFLKFDYDYIEQFLKDLNIRKIQFIGEKTEQRLHFLNIHKCSDIIDRYVDLFYLYESRLFDFFISSALGIGHYFHRESEECKSISRSKSFRMTNNTVEIRKIFDKIVQKVIDDMKDEEVKAKTLTVEVIGENERKTSRCLTKEQEFNEESLMSNGWEILENLILKCGRIRMLRIKLSGLNRKIEDDCNSIVTWINNLKDGPMKNESKKHKEIPDEINEDKRMINPQGAIENKIINIDKNLSKKKVSKNRKTVSFKSLDIVQLLTNLKQYAQSTENKPKKQIIIQKKKSPFNLIINQKRNYHSKSLKKLNYLSIESFFKTKQSE